MTMPSAALSSASDTSIDTEPPTTRTLQVERRTPTTREALATLPESVIEPFPFEPHDTIPAPPWLDEADESGAPDAPVQNTP